MTELRAQGTGHRAQGTGHRAQGTGPGHRAQGSGLRAQGTGHRAQGTGGLRAQGSGQVRASGTARAQGAGLWVIGSSAQAGLNAQGSEHRAESWLRGDENHLWDNVIARIARWRETKQSAWSLRCHPEITPAGVHCPHGSMMRRAT